MILRFVKWVWSCVCMAILFSVAALLFWTAAFYIRDATNWLGKKLFALGAKPIPAKVIPLAKPYVPPKPTLQLTLQMSKEKECHFHPKPKYWNFWYCEKDGHKAVKHLYKHPPKTPWDHDKKLYMYEVALGACRDWMEYEIELECLKWPRTVRKIGK